MSCKYTTAKCRASRHSHVQKFLCRIPSTARDHVCSAACNAVYSGLCCVPAGHTSRRAGRKGPTGPCKRSRHEVSQCVVVCPGQQCIICSCSCESACCSLQRSVTALGNTSSAIVAEMVPSQLPHTCDYPQQWGTAHEAMRVRKVREVRKGLVVLIKIRIMLERCMRGAQSRGRQL